MKIVLLLFTTFLLALTISAQDYCLLNAQKTFNFGDNFQDKSVEIIEQPDGRFLIIGTGFVNIATTRYIEAIRVTPDGNPDPSFGDLGRRMHSFEEGNTVTCSELQDDGRILVAGDQSQGTSLARVPYVARLNTDGTVDGGFGVGGSAVVPLGVLTPGQVTAMKYFPNGEIVIISSKNSISGNMFAKLQSNGNPVVNYGDGGSIHHPLSSSITFLDTPIGEIMDDGSAVAIGRTTSLAGGQLYLMKVDPDGDLDSGFGINGIKHLTELPGNVHYHIRSATDFDGNILISGKLSGLSFVTKIDIESGELITDFGENGVLFVPIEGNGLDCYQFVKDEVNQEWVLALHVTGTGPGTGSATMRINSAGDIIEDCNDLVSFNDFGNIYSSVLSCGIFDSQGILRMSGWSGIVDEDSPIEAQSQNFMWPSYIPAEEDPFVQSVVPNEILIDDATEITVKGLGFDEVEDAWLATSSGNIVQTLIKNIDDETLKITFNIPNMDLELVNLVVYNSEVGNLTLPNAIQMIDERIVDVVVSNQSRSRVLAGASYLLHTSIENIGTTNILAAPLIYVNHPAAAIDFSYQPAHDYTEDPNMTSFIGYISGITDPTVLNKVSYDYQGEVPEDSYTSHAYLSSYLAPEGTGDVAGFTTVSDLGLTKITTVQNPNGILPSKAIVPGSLLSPGPCVFEMVRVSMLEAVPSLNVTAYGVCFDDVFISNQEELASTIQSFERYQVIPMTGFLYKLFYDMMNCVDTDHVFDAVQFETFTKEMITKFTHLRKLSPETYCDGFLISLDTDNDDIFNDDSTDPNDPDPTNPDPGLGPQNPGNPIPGGPNGPSGNRCFGCINQDDWEGVSSLDPNEKNGPTNLIDGPYVNYGNFQYDIHFENIATADVAAKTVYVVDSLDTSALDLSTFKFRYASWGVNVISLDEHSGVTEVDLRPEVPNILRITTELNEIEGVATWRFETLDTLSLYPTEDVNAGFLPPNITSPEGMGFVSFDVHLLETVESGTPVSNKANIYFDFNDVITTNTWFNIFDNVAPESAVNEITDYVGGENTVNITWDSEEEDIRFYNIYYNTDGGNIWEPWKVGTQDNAATFEGELGNTYYFRSVAIDSALNIEAFSEVYDALIYLNPVGIDEVNQDHLFSLYPNPANESVVISVTNQQVDNVVITDMTGRVVLSQKIDRNNGQNMLNLDDMANGIYNVSVRDGEGRIIGQKKLMVHRE